MNTTEFRSFFPSIITNSLFNDSYLDRTFEKLNSFPEHFSTMKKYRISAEENLWKIEIPLPGASKEDIKISLKEADRLLVEVTGENEWTMGEKRNFKVPASADLDNISAEMKNGLLTLTVPKKKAFQDKLVKVK